MTQDGVVHFEVYRGSLEEGQEEEEWQTNTKKGWVRGVANV